MKMDLDQLNRWLAVFANLGVMIGLIFLIFELDQSNRIAERDSRQANARAIFDMSQLQLEMPGVAELRVKLADRDAELTPTEQEQARLIAWAYLSIWGNLVIQQSTDLLPESSLIFGKRDIDATVDSLPRLVPYIEEWFIERNIRPGQSAPIWNHVWEAAARNGGEAVPAATE